MQTGIQNAKFSLFVYVYRIKMGMRWKTLKKMAKERHWKIFAYLGRLSFLLQKVFFCRLRISCHRTRIIITKSDKKTGQRIADDFNRDLIVREKCPEENTRFLQILTERERERARFHHRE